MSATGRGRWHARPVLGVADAVRAAAFYEERLGFARDWEHAEDGRLLVAQVSRAGCELILSSQWPERVGHGLTFVSLERDAWLALVEELRTRGAPVEDGWWGYPLKLVRDPDGNTLYFPEDAAAEEARP